jgi:hypothetical protein
MLMRELTRPSSIKRPENKRLKTINTTLNPRIKHRVERISRDRLKAGPEPASPA